MLSHRKGAQRGGVNIFKYVKDTKNVDFEELDNYYLPRNTRNTQDPRRR